MAGHRRISTDLFLKYRRRSREDAREATPIEALLELDLDEWRGRIGPNGPAVKTYARFWGWTPSRARRLISEWKEHAEDRGNVGKANPRRTLDEPSANPPANPLNGTNPDAYGVSTNPLSNPSRTPGEPPANPILEPEPEQEGRRALPRSPSASLGDRRVGPSESRKRSADREVDLALARVADPENLGPTEVRLRILAETFLASGRIADEAQLRGYCRTTSELAPVILKAACDAARADPANARGFPPSEASILAIGRKLSARARRASREGA